jgi:hypothetical protein
VFWTQGDTGKMGVSNIKWGGRNKEGKAKVKEKEEGRERGGRDMGRQVWER